MAEERQRSCRALPFDQVKSILILYNAEDHDALQKAFNALRSQQKQLHTCLFVESDTLSEKVKKSAIIVDKQQLSPWGFPREEIEKRLSAISADLLIDLTRPGCYAMQYLALRHSTPFRVGLKYPGQEWYDMGLLVAERNEIDYLFEQILFYLHTFDA